MPTLIELKKTAREKGLVGYSKMRKNDLIKFLNGVIETPLDLLLKKHSLSLSDAKEICHRIRSSPKRSSPKRRSLNKKSSPKRRSSPANKDFSTYEDYTKKILGATTKYKNLEAVISHHIENKKYDDLADLIEKVMKNKKFIKTNYNAIVSSLEDIISITHRKKPAKELREYAQMLLDDFRMDDDDDDYSEDEDYEMPNEKTKNKLPDKIKSPIKPRRRIIPTLVL